MSLGTMNRDGGKTSESGHLRPIYKGIPGEVLNGLAVSQRGAGANMSVDLAIGDCIIPRSDATYGHNAYNDAVLNVAVTAADGSNPRRDILVLYIDYGEAPDTGVSNNTNGVVKCIIVAGTAAGSPADPTDAAIQSAVTAGNPFIKLARIRVGTGVTSISNSVIDDLRTLSEAASGGWRPQSSAWDAWAYSAWDGTNKLATITVPDSSEINIKERVRYWQLTGGWKYGEVFRIVDSTHIMVYQGANYTLNNERIYVPSVSNRRAPKGFADLGFDTPYIFDHVISGCEITADAPGSTRLASMAVGWVWINGRRLLCTGSANRTYTASKDVYVDASDNGDGTVLLTFTDVNNNAASPALAANSVRLGIVVVGAGNIAAQTSVNQGQETMLLPIVSSVPYAVTDSLGNLICPRDPERRLLGNRQTSGTSFTTASATDVGITGLSAPVIIPPGRKIRATLHASAVYNNSSGCQARPTIWDGTVASGTQLQFGTNLSGAGAIGANPANMTVPKTLAAGAHTINAGLRQVSGGTAQFEDTGDGNGVKFIMVELL